MTVAKWKWSDGNKYYCSNCFFSTKVPHYTCKFCGAMMTNLEQIINDLTHAQNYDIIKKIAEGMEDDLDE